ncbi:MAG: NifU family protein [Candidatus Omnitrophica bacterium]|nr:NifU family protein [Candidatus Omnitrophota bacterium]
MNPQLMIQSTPNPNALKFVLNVPVKTSGNWTYKSAQECADNSLAAAVFALDSHVREVYFFDNYITVTQDGDSDWDALEEKIRATIMAKIAAHDPDFRTSEPQEKPQAAAAQSPEMAQINTILDQTVRPALQMDGGDIQLVEYKNNTLRVFYQGACGSCPSSTMGTLKAIENILKDQFNPDVVVELADAF